MVDILVIGAGLAGLSAGKKLADKGYQVLVVDKGKSVGGRLASRSLESASFDYGAQFMTAKDPRFLDQVNIWVSNGTAELWFRGYPGRTENYKRWRGVPNMKELARSLAGALNINTARQVLRITLQQGRWRVDFKDGSVICANNILLTPPVPQSLEIIDRGNTKLSQDQRFRLQQLTYDPCIAMLALLEGPSKIISPGILIPNSDDIDWISDNMKKGVSQIPSVTIHASSDFSKTHFNEDSDEVGRKIIKLSKSWLGVAVKHFAIHRWRYSKPKYVDAERFMLIQSNPTLIIAGDAFAGPRVEGAFLSGCSAAEALIAHFEQY